MEIVIDLDEVIYPFTEAFIKTYNLLRPDAQVEIPQESVDYDISSWPGVDKASADRVFGLMVPDKYVSENPYPLVKEFLEYLDSMGHFITILTARAVKIPNLAIATEEWLTKHSLPYHRLVVVPHGFAKHDFCTAWGADILIDDKFEIITSAQGKVKVPILWDAPWNWRKSNFEKFRAKSFLLGEQSILSILQREFGQVSFPPIDLIFTAPNDTGQFTQTILEAENE